MKYLRHFCIAFLLACAFVLFAGVIYSQINPESVDVVSEWVENYLALTLLSLPAFMGFVYLISFLFPVYSRTRMTFENEGGKVEVRLSAATHYVRKLATEFPEIKTMNPILSGRGETLEIDLRLGLNAGAQIAELSQRVQDRMRDVLKHDLGLTAAPNINVTIVKIFGKPRQNDLDYSRADITEPAMTEGEEEKIDKEY